MTTATDRPKIMTKEEMVEAEKRVEGKVSPFNSSKGRKATPIPAAPATKIIAPDGHVRQSVGVFTKPAQMGDAGTLKRFAHIPTDRTGWIEMNDEQAKEYEENRLLVAYDPDEGLGLLNRTPTPHSVKKGV